MRRQPNRRRTLGNRSFGAMAALVAAGMLACSEGSVSSLSTGSVVADYERALSLRDPLERHLLLAEVYQRVDASNFDEIRAVFERRLKSRRSWDTRVLGRMWAEFDRKEALGSVLEWPSAQHRRDAADEILYLWIEQENSAAAVAAIDSVGGSLPSGVVAESQISLAEALARAGERDTLESILEAEQDETQRQRLIAKAALAMSRRDPGNISDWARAVHADPERSATVKKEIIVQVLRFELARDLEGGVAFFEEVSEGDHSAEAILVIAERWARKDPEAAFAWLRARPASQQPGMGLRAATYAWLQTDHRTAAPILREWIDSDPVMEPAIFAYVQYLMAVDLEEAMELAKRVPIEEERDILLKQGLSRWARMEPEKLDRYLAKNEVSNEVQKAVQVARQLREKRIESEATP